MTNFNEYANFIWQIAELLRGPYRPNEYKYVMLPLTVLRRLDCLLEPTKDEVPAKYEELEQGSLET
jgi:type I restriction enzyme M protein